GFCDRILGAARCAAPAVVFTRLADRGAYCVLNRINGHANWVKFFNTDRGFGFIAPDGGGSDVFVDVHDVEVAGMKPLVADQLVAYEVGPAQDGRSKAVNLRSLNKR